METKNCLTSACRYCRYYQPEGRRGGICQQLEVPVQANWKACSLATPAFATAWQDLEEILKWPDPALVLVSSQPLTCDLEHSQLAPVDEAAA